jgi:exopolyphosphatase/guanosine-5'-triphosphate,3'-diphosphate pyrophosphatase
MHPQNQVKSHTDQFLNSAIMIGSAVSGSFASCVFLTHQVTQIQSQAQQGVTATTCAHIAFRVGMIAGVIFFQPAVSVITEGLSISEHIYKLGSGEGKVAYHLTRIAVSSLSIAAQVTLSLELIVLNLALNILSEANAARDGFRSGNYIEACGHIVAASIRGYQNRASVKQLITKWAPKKEIQPSPLIEQSMFPPKSIDPTIERRIAIDVGSGSTKVVIADIDTTTNKIIQIVYEDSFPVPYQKSLEKSMDSTFDDTIQNQGIAVFSKIKQLAFDSGATKIAAIATEAFRLSKNGDAFTAKILQETGINLAIIPQEMEGTLAFESATSAVTTNPDNIICWDIGTGSYQITTKKQANYQIFQGGLGSVPFQKLIATESTSLSCLMTKDQIKIADAKARKQGRSATKEMKLKIKDKGMHIVGIGRLFAKSIGGIIPDSNVVTRKALRTFIANTASQDPADSSDPFAKIDLANAILVLGFMKALHMQEINLIDTSTSHGILVHDEFWAENPVKSI